MSISRGVCFFALTFICAALATAAIVGNPGVSRAEPLGSDIVCDVFTTLTGLGSPIPTLDGGNCPGVPPAPPPPPPSPPPAACADGIDNDVDGLIDMADPGCADASDSDESDPIPPPPSPPSPQCSDGLDNDNDGKADADDPGCTGGPSDDDETDPVEDGDDDAPAPSPSPSPSPTPSPAPTATATPSPSPSSGGGGSGGGGGGGGGLPPGTTLYTSTSTGSGVPVGQVLGSTVFSTTTESCDRYLRAFIREGKENDADQVKRLQRFLKDFESAAVGETGIYDKPTLAAVHVFQAKYAADILTPWGIEESTGYVYLTSRKKVNEIYCGFSKIFYLTVEEQKKIDDSRSQAVPLSQNMALPLGGGRPQALPASVADKIASGTGMTATTTDKGQGFIERSRRFLHDLLDRVR